jgi:chemotaxis protein histidine kinase CheA
MKRIKSSIKEGLADNVSKYLMYSFFVDLYPLVNKKGGLLTIMFPNVGLNKLSRWVGNIGENELYTSNAENLQKIYSRVSSSTQLKTLYRAVNTLKSKDTNSEENDKRISDIQLIIEKIYRVIKTKLTQDERQLFDKFSSLLDGAADQAGKSLEGSIGASTKTVEPEEEPKEEPTKKPEESPKEEPTEEPKETPKEEPTEKPKEEPSPESEEEKTKAEESLKMEEYLKSLIRELVERKLGLK